MVRLVNGPISADEALRAVSSPACGGTVLFIGTVRHDADTEGADALDYESYAPMAERKLEEIAAGIRKQDPDARVAILHRVGRVPVGEASVIIAVAAPHRAAAFEACRGAMEALKRDVPIWKV